MDHEETTVDMTRRMITMRQNNYIPQQQMNPLSILTGFQKFKREFYEQNGKNADPEAAFMQHIQDNNIDQNTISQAVNIGKQFGFF